MSEYTEPLHRLSKMPGCEQITEELQDELDDQIDDEQRFFKAWYVENAFDYEKDPIGSRDCNMQWMAWKAAIEGYLQRPNPEPSLAATKDIAP